MTIVTMEISVFDNDEKRILILEIGELDFNKSVFITIYCLYVGLRPGTRTHERQHGCKVTIWKNDKMSNRQTYVQVYQNIEDYTCKRQHKVIVQSSNSCITKKISDQVVFWSFRNCNKFRPVSQVQLFHPF